MQISKKTFVLVITILITSILPNAFADEPSPQTQEIENAYYLSAKTGSNLAFAKLKLLEHKNPEAAKAARGHAEALAYSISSPSLNSVSFESLMADTPLGISGELDLLTGKQAIDESLQLDTIAQQPPSWRPTPTINPADAALVDVNTIEALNIKSLPWEEMLRGREVPAVPKIFNLVPRDHFVIHFDFLAKLTELENALKKVATPFTSFIETEQPSEIKARVAERLGIKNLGVLERLVSEIAFVSEDLDFYPSTHFALILGIRSKLLESLSEYISPGKAFSEKVGDYLVLSSSPGLLEKIRSTFSKPETSLQSALEMRYALSAIDKRHDGMIYFSEPFILKMVSAPYRINSARRFAVSRKLESLQYVVYAYRSITKKWPSSFGQIEDEGYIEKGSVPSEYQISSDGIVSQAIWGSLNNLKPISDVPLEQVTVAEKTRYDSFRNGYQSYWHEFFDPIAIGLTIGDQIYINTVILPLIDNSQYKFMKEMFAKGEGMLKSISSILRIPAITLAANINADDAILDEGHFIRSVTSDKPPASRQDRMAKINSDIQNDLELDTPIDVFNMIGDEIVLGIDGNQSFVLQNIADADVFIALQLKDTDRFKKLINSVYKSMFKQMRNSGGGIPFLQLSSEEPLQNEYKSVKYYMIPAGFTNLFLLYHDDFVYFAISQLSINRLIDSINAPAQASRYQKRALDYVGLVNNILLLADFDTAIKIKDTARDWSAYGLSSAARNFYGYLGDLDLLQQSLVEESLDISKYVPWIPKSIAGVKIAFKDGRLILGEEKPLTIEEVKFSGSSGSYLAEQDWLKSYGKNDSVEFVSLIPAAYHRKFRENLDNLKSLAIGLAFTKEGLNTKLTVHNPLSMAADNRFKLSQPAHGTPNLAFGTGKIDNGSIKIVALGVILAMGLFIVWLVRRKRG